MSKNNPRNLSRRDFLNTATTGAATLLCPAWLRSSAYEIDPRIAKVMAATIGIDMHNHVYPTGTKPSPHFDPSAGKSDQPQHQHPPQQTQSPSLSLATEIKLSGLTAICASYVLDFATNDKPGDAMSNYLGWHSVMDAELASGHMRRALTLADLQTAHNDHQPTIIQTVEGAMFLEGKLENLSIVYKRGLRHLQLLHMRDDLIKPLGDVITSPTHLGGLTPFGADIIRECNRFGILVDMAHASTETVEAAIKISNQPILYSHTGLNTRLGKSPDTVGGMLVHLISKEHAKVIADSGGVVGVWTKLTDTPEDYAENIRAMVDVIGVEHVGIGTDQDLLSQRSGQGLNKTWPNEKGFFYEVVNAMLQTGFSPEEIAKIGGGNYCRLFGKATSVHA